MFFNTQILFENEEGAAEWLNASFDFDFISGYFQSGEDTTMIVLEGIEYIINMEFNNFNQLFTQYRYNLSTN